MRRASCTDPKPRRAHRCLVLLAMLGSACDADDGDPQAEAQAAEIAEKTCEGLAAYTVPGPYATGVTTIDFDGTTMEIWYPADPGAIQDLEKDRYDLRDWLPAEHRDRIPDEVDVGFVTDAFRDATPVADQGPFPVVLFSHGLGGLRLQSSFLTTHLASWGMVVIAPEHVERNMTTVVWGQFETDRAPQTHREVIANLPAIASAAGLDGLLDPQRIAMTGHSQGGATVALVGADPGVAAWMSMASNALPQSSMDNDIRDRPGLVMGGTADDISGGQERDQYGFLEANDKRLMLIRDAGHMAFTDFCPIAADRGGIFAVAIEYGVPIEEEIADLVSSLVRDGCETDELPVDRAWPIIRHYATAHLLLAFGEADTSGLDSKTTTCFGTDVDTLAHN